MIGVPPSPLAARLHAPELVLWATFSRNAELLAGALLVALPVFLQAPWVRLAPLTATLFTAALLTAGILLEQQFRGRYGEAGSLLVGFSGSWLAGCLFWGWCRLHPIWHLPIEAFALPLALAGLRSRWRLGCALYLGSLLGTAATDAAIAATGLMPLWPQVLAAAPADAALLLQQAGQRVLAPPLPRPGTDCRDPAGSGLPLALVARPERSCCQYSPGHHPGHRWPVFGGGPAGSSAQRPDLSLIWPLI